MTIQKHRLYAREQRIAAIEMAPARLDHSNLRIGEEVHGRFQQLRLRDKVSVENANELASSGRQSRFQCAGLEADAIDPADQFNMESFRDEPPDAGAG